MADFSFAIEVLGEGSFSLPVKVAGGGQPLLKVSPNGGASLDFEITNPLDRDITLTQIAAGMVEEAADKFEVSLLFTVLAIAAGQTATNTVTVTALTGDVSEADRAGVVITGVEG